MTTPIDAATIAMLEASSWRGPRDVLVDCAGCGYPFWRHPVTQEALYCSDTCRQTAWKRRAYGHRRTLRAVRSAPARTVSPALVATKHPLEGCFRDKLRWDWEQWR